MIVTEVQKAVLLGLFEGVEASPRGSCERLRKKGLVRGDRKAGWCLTDEGRRYVTAMQWGK